MTKLVNSPHGGVVLLKGSRLVNSPQGGVIKAADAPANTLYAVVTSSLTQPSEAQIKAGQDHTGAAAVWAGSWTPSASPTTAPITGLTAGQWYATHFYQEDGADTSNILSSAALWQAQASSISATISLVLPAITAGATGTEYETHSATVSIMLPAIGGAATGVEYETHTGTFALTLPAITGAATGTEYGGISGDIGIVLPAITAGATGAEYGIHTATIGIDLPAIVSAATGTEYGTHTGTLGLTLPAITAGATGVEYGVHTATVGLVLPAITSAATGSIGGAIGGTFSLVLPAITAGATGTEYEVHTGTVALNLPAIEGGAAATEYGTHTGTLGLTLPAITGGATGVGAGAILGNVGIVLPAISSGATGDFTSTITGTIGLTLPAFTTAATGREFNPNGGGLSQEEVEAIVAAAVAPLNTQIATLTAQLNTFQGAASSCGTAVTTSGICGTGLTNLGSKPGDPDLDTSSLTARAGPTRIFLDWSFPNVNPHAVAHTHVYRSTVNNSANAVKIATLNANQYTDERVEIGTTYYYWVRMVSINGTLGDYVGPAAATPFDSIESLINELTNRLTESALNQDLRAKIDLITDLSSSLTEETQERLLGDNYFTQILESWANDLAAIDTLVRSEIQERIEGDDALVVAVNAILAKSEDNAAAILEETAVRATETDALALEQTTFQATLDGVSASLQTVEQVVAGPDGLTAQYMLKTDVDGNVAGFGLYNDGATSDFIVNANTFAVGLPGEESEFPFIIGEVGGDTKIVLNAQTLIPDAAITNAQIGNSIHSDDFNLFTQGWGIFKDGAGPNGDESLAVFHNIYARGDIEASTLKAGIVEAQHIKGGAISQVKTDVTWGLTIMPNQEVFGFTITPDIPEDFNANVLCMINFQGGAQGESTSLGVKVYKIWPNGARTTMHTADVSAAKGLTQGSATSFSDGNCPPGSRYEFYMRNTWHQGSIINGLIRGNMLVAFL